MTASRAERDIGLLEAMATTRAIRRYTADPIPDDDLAEILWYAQRAPSGTNRQKFRFITLRRDDPVAQPARELLTASFRTGWVAKRADLDRDGEPEDGSPRFRMQAAMQHYVDHIDTVPVVVLVGLERYRPPNPAEGASVYPACQNLLLAARALGYGGVMTGWHAAVEAELREVIGAPRRRRPVRHDHAGRAGRAPRTAAPQAVALARARRRVGPRGRLARRAWRLTTPSTSWGSRRTRPSTSCAPRGGAWRWTSTPTAPGDRRPPRGDAAAERGVRPCPGAARRAGGGSRRRARRRRPAPAPPDVRAPVPRPGGRLAHDVASFTIEALPVEAFEALLIVATWLGEPLDDDPPYRLDVAARRAVRLLVPPRPRARRRRQHRRPDARQHRRPPRPRPRRGPRRLGRRAQQPRPARHPEVLPIRVLRSDGQRAAAFGRRSRMAWPRPIGRRQHGDDAVGAGVVGRPQLGVQLAGVGDEVVAVVDRRRRAGRRARTPQPGRRPRRGRARARPGPAARSATPASRRHATDRSPRRGRGRGAARRPRWGCRRAAAAAGDRSCSRRSSTRRRSGSARRRARRREPGRGTGRGRRRRARAVVGLTRPNRLADGAAMPSPVAASSSLASAGGRAPAARRCRGRR